MLKLWFFLWTFITINSLTVSFSYSRTMSSKATLALLIYGIIMHYSVNCSPVGLSFPTVRYVLHHFISKVSRCWFLFSSCCMHRGGTGGLDTAAAAGGHRAKIIPDSQLVMSAATIAFIGLLDNSVWQPIHRAAHTEIIAKKHPPGSGSNVI